MIFFKYYLVQNSVLYDDMYSLFAQSTFHHFEYPHYPYFPSLVPLTGEFQSRPDGCPPTPCPAALARTGASNAKAATGLRCAPQPSLFLPACRDTPFLRGTLFRSKAAGCCGASVLIGCATRPLRAAPPSPCVVSNAMHACMHACQPRSPYMHA